MCFNLRFDKESFLQAVKGQTPYTFEENQLSFFQDLSRQTLQWRASFNGINSQLRAADIPYKWGYPRALIAEKDGHQSWLTSPSDTAAFQQSLGLTATQSAHHWDVANVAAFTLLRSTAPG
ncbi:Hypothetical predicted protein [Pelobates cultripes]|uniref:Uncharacterized protein n=1 Tax=Pelobates cultripes TaxID=61616 RepID=A0AAD1RQ32_PELCU|nr:Hypothetical predicted protein [Pelobates cultripes]